MRELRQLLARDRDHGVPHDPAKEKEVEQVVDRVLVVAAEALEQGGPLIVREALEY